MLPDGIAVVFGGHCRTFLNDVFSTVLPTPLPTTLPTSQPMPLPTPVPTTTTTTTARADGEMDPSWISESQWICDVFCGYDEIATAATCEDPPASEDWRSGVELACATPSVIKTNLVENAKTHQSLLGCCCWNSRLYGGCRCRVVVQHSMLCEQQHPTSAGGVFACVADLVYGRAAVATFFDEVTASSSRVASAFERVASILDE